MRLFVALQLDAPTRAAIETVQAELRAADRSHQVLWVEPRGIHLTFKFLGEVSEARVPELVEALEGAIRDGHAPHIALASVGGFPSLRRPRVIWLGLSEAGDALAALHQAIDVALEPLGWERETRPFQPHLTLGRVKEEARGRPQPLEPHLLRVLEQVRAPALDARAQDRLALVRSHLSHAGAHYEDLNGWRLATS